MGNQKSINHRTENTKGKKKKIIYETQHGKMAIEQHEPH